MSVKALGWAFDQEVGDPTAKLILIALADFADQQGKSWPSRKKLAKYADCSVDTVDRKLALLETKKLLKKEKRLHAAGDPTSNSYQLTPLPKGSPQFAATQPQSCAATVGAELCGYHGEPPKNPPPKIGMPEKLQTPAFLQVWEKWKQFRVEIRKPLTQTSTLEQWSVLSQMGPEKATECLLASIRNGWQGIFPDRVPQNRPNDPKIVDFKKNGEDYERLLREEEAKAQAKWEAQQKG